MGKLDINEPKILSWNDLRQGMEVSLPLIIEQKDLDAFASLSGDRNPLHVDGNFARGKGFSGKIVYGALIVAHISRLIGMHLPGRDSIWIDLNITFRSPLMIGQEAELRGSLQGKSDAARTVTLLLTLISNGMTLAEGTAEVMVKE